MRKRFNPDRICLTHQYLHFVVILSVILFLMANLLVVRSMSVVGVVFNDVYLLCPIIYGCLSYIQVIYGKKHMLFTLLLMALCSLLFLAYIKVTLVIQAPLSWYIVDAYDMILQRYVDNFILLNVAFFLAAIANILLMTMVTQVIKGQKFDIPLINNLVMITIFHRLFFYLHPPQNIEYSDQMLLLMVYTLMIFPWLSFVFHRLYGLESMAGCLTKKKQHQNNFSQLTYYTPIALLLTFVYIAPKFLYIKTFTLFGMQFSAGSIIFPLSYIFSDILTEVYGFRRTRSILWFAIGIYVIWLLLVMLLKNVPSSDMAYIKYSFHEVFSWQAKVLIASICSFSLGNFINCYSHAKLKIFHGDKHIVFRFITSTLLGTLFDVIIFLIIVYANMFSGYAMLWFIFCNCGMAILYEFSLASFSVWISHLLKRAEKIDIYDNDTHFSPLSFEVDYSEYANQFVNDGKTET